MTESYVTFTYYQSTYLGTAITETNFPRLALRASAVIDSLTFNRAADETDIGIIDDIKMAVCAVAEEIQTAENSGADGIQSETIGSNSVTYSENATQQRTAMQKYEIAASTYLGLTGLMFRGFASGEYSGDSDDED